MYVNIPRSHARFNPHIRSNSCTRTHARAYARTHHMQAQTRGRVQSHIITQTQDTHSCARRHTHTPTYTRTNTQTMVIFVITDHEVRPCQAQIYFLQSVCTVLVPTTRNPYSEGGGEGGARARANPSCMNTRERREYTHTHTHAIMSVKTANGQGKGSC